MSTHFLPIGRDVSLLTMNLVLLEQKMDGLCKEHGSDVPLEDFDRGNLKTIALLAETLAKSIWIEPTILAAMQLSITLKSPCTIGKVRHETEGLKNLLLRDLFNPLFLPASKDMLEYFGKQSPFGKAVEKAFPECSDDIVEAHQCFAFERYTASVFHLGRVMELATKKFAKRIKAKTPARDEFQKWLSAINEVIGAMKFNTPQQRKKREPLAEAAAYLLHFKEVWRNKTMHPERSYTREQAIKILEGTQLFLDSVSRRIFKAKV